ncbi:unnamed protein product [Spirodela intermedia]|uniref:Uncharacterized protein n=1 Tax=Spirodela intermedia TaxID=51605 RepID=A0A7I8IPN2_SPIIN|nr:unnamed protein product [Spirodela intermedia]CAA6659927.1 unnamed protein product [Spirodela intermedia]
MIRVGITQWGLSRHKIHAKPWRRRGSLQLSVIKRCVNREIHGLRKKK